jgi:hypothetical protein
MSNRAFNRRFVNHRGYVSITSLPFFAGAPFIRAFGMNGEGVNSTTTLMAASSQTLSSPSISQIPANPTKQTPDSFQKLGVITPPNPLSS